MSHGGYLNADWQPATARVDLLWGDDNDEPVWSEPSSVLTRRSFADADTEVHYVKVSEEFDGWVARCIDCHWRHVDEHEAVAFEVAGTHGFVEGWC